MHLYLNGRFLSQTTTGVQRMAREFTRAVDTLIMEQRFQDVQVTLLVQPDARFGDLDLKSVHVKTIPGATGHVWEQMLLPFHVGDGTLLNLGNTLPLASLARARQVSVVLHDLSYRLFPTAYKWRYRVAHRVMDAILARRADPLITVSESERSMINRLYPHAARHLEVAPNGSWIGDQLEPLPPSRQTANGYGLYVGSLSRRKNVDGVLATAIALARKRGLAFKLVGQSNAILNEIRTQVPSDLNHLIEFCGQVDDQSSLKALYRDAAFLLFPSFYEASALPPLEAMAQRCPVIVSNIPSLVERCGDAACYCDPHSVSSIEAAVCRVLDDPALRERIVEQGAARAHRFTWRRQAEAILTVLRDRAR